MVRCSLGVEPATTYPANHPRTRAFCMSHMYYLCTACTACTRHAPQTHTPHSPHVYTPTSPQIRRPNNYDPNAALMLGPPDPNPTMDLSELRIVRTVVLDSPNKLFVGGLPCEWTEEQVGGLWCSGASSHVDPHSMIHVATGQGTATTVWPLACIQSCDG